MCIESVLFTVLLEVCNDCSVCHLTMYTVHLTSTLTAVVTFCQCCIDFRTLELHTLIFIQCYTMFCPQWLGVGTTLDGVIVTSDTSQVHDPSSNSCFFATTTHLALGRTLVIIILYIVFYYAIIIQCMHVYI